MPLPSGTVCGVSLPGSVASAMCPSLRSPCPENAHPGLWEDGAGAGPQKASAALRFLERLVAMETCCLGELRSA